jgi:hypothetical protein
MTGADLRIRRRVRLFMIGAISCASASEAFIPTES